MRHMCKPRFQLYNNKIGNAFKRLTSDAMYLVQNPKISKKIIFFIASLATIVMRVISEINLKV